MKRILSVMLAWVMVLTTVLAAGLTVLAAPAATVSTYSGTPDYSWYVNSDGTLKNGAGDLGNEYTLTTADQFIAFRNLSNGYLDEAKTQAVTVGGQAIAAQTFAGKVIKLDVDVVVNQGDAAEWFANTNYYYDTATSSTVSQSVTGLKDYWRPIGDLYNGSSNNSTGEFKGTFDGQGHTISGIYCVGARDNGMFGKMTGTVKSFALVNSVIYNNGLAKNAQSATQNIGGIVNRLYGGHVEGVFCDAYVRGAQGVGGIAGEIQSAASIKKCVFAGYIDASTSQGWGPFVSGISGYTDGSAIVISDCAVLGSIYYGVRKLTADADATPNASATAVGAAGAIGNVNTNNIIKNILSSATLTVADGRAAKDANDKPYYAGAINISGNKTGASIANVIFDSTKAGTTAYQPATVDPSSWSMSISGVLAKTSEEMKTLTLDWENWTKNDTYGYIPTAIHEMLMAEPESNEPPAPSQPVTPVVPTARTTAKALKGEPVDLSWYENSPENATEYVIDTPAELRGFAFLVNQGAGSDFSGVTVKLGADLVMNEGDASTWTENTTGLTVWTPIGNATEKTGAHFSGTFDGQGHVISGIYSVKARDNGLFGYVDGTVKNLVITNSAFINNGTSHASGRQWALQGVGSAVNRLNGTLENVYSDAYVYGGAACGGLVGYFQGDVAMGGATIRNCVYAGTLNVSSLAGGGGAGGIYGSDDYNTKSGKTGPLTLENCAFVGKIVANKYYEVLGGTPIETADCHNLGCIGGNNQRTKISNVLVKGSIEGDRKMDYVSVIGALRKEARLTTASVSNISYCTDGLPAGAKAYAFGSRTDTETDIAVNMIKGFSAADYTTANLTTFDFTNAWTTVDGMMGPKMALAMWEPLKDVDFTAFTLDTYVAPETDDDEDSWSSDFEDIDDDFDVNDIREARGEETTAPETTQEPNKKKGCKNMVGVGAMALFISAVAMGASVIHRKKED